MNSDHKKNRLGFTLIELLVVIAIIGLLASIILASLNTSRAKSRDARRIADLNQLQKALELYGNDNSGNYPSSATTVAAGGENATTSLLALVAGDHIPVIPNDPLGGLNTYVYKTIPADHVANDATGYCIGAYIEGFAPAASTTCAAAASLLGVSQGLNNINYEVGN